MIKFILTHNHFEFNGCHYRQKNGTAMGTKMAPSYANIFMANLENNMLSSFELKPSYYCRYIDDIFFIWEHGLDSLIKFSDHCNSYHSSIKFTMDHSKSNLPFLDVSINLNNGNITTSVYVKPTDNNRYLDYRSSHPMSLKRSLIYSQCLRLKRICSCPSDYNKHISLLTGKFMSSKYPLSVIKSQIEKASHKSRTDLLIYRPKLKNDRLPMVFDYSPNITQLSKKIKKDFLSLQEDPSINSGVTLGR